jgi:hypothetical protein
MYDEQGTKMLHLKNKLLETDFFKNYQSRNRLNFRIHH